MKKLFLFFRLNVLYMFRNKARFILTLSGVSIGLLIYMLGNAGVDCYLERLYRNAKDFDTDGILVHDTEGELIDKIRNYDSNIHINRYCSELVAYSTDKDYIYKGISVNNSIELIGTDGGVVNEAVPYMKNETMYLAQARLLYGTGFTEDDIKKGTNSIVIEKSTSLFWFQKENAVGEYVDVVSPYGYDRFVVVGVIEDLPGKRSDNMRYNKTIQHADVAEFNNSSVAYTTYNYLANMMGNHGFMEWYTLNVTGREDGEQIKSLIYNLNENASLFSTPASIITQQVLLEEVGATERTLRVFINAIIVALILISGFMIVTIYVFSVKERTYEIGVRRALGAAEFDIVLQFVIEGVITSLVAYVVVLFFGAVVCNLATACLVSRFYMDIRLVLSWKLILSALGLAVLQGVLFSMLPALIASKIRPTEAIRWD